MKHFIKGQKAKLTSLTPATTLEVAIGLGFPTAQAVNLSCFGLDVDNQLPYMNYLISHNDKSSPDGSLRMLEGASPNNQEQRFAVDLARLPQEIRKVAFAVSLSSRGTMADLHQGYLRLLANGVEVMRYTFSGADFNQERAVIIGELYFKGVWRVAAVGQGFRGDISDLLNHFGADQARKRQTAPPSRVKEVPVAPTAPPARPSKSVSLEKRLEKEAPQLVSLVKKAAVSIKKAGLEEHRAKVALCLDISGSMSRLYSSGKIQRLAERILALGCKFDEDGSIDIFLFGRHAHQADSMTIGNFKQYIGQLTRKYPLEGSTYYGQVIQMIRQFYFPQTRGRQRTSPISAELPVYVMFVTDGDTFDPDLTKEELRQSSFEPIFWQFMAIGKSNKSTGFFGFLKNSSTSGFTFLEQLDNMSGRYLDNADFFTVADPQDISDKELYDLLMTEYPNWVKSAKAKRLLK